jgi:Protein of unknown function (DUF1579)
MLLFACNNNAEKTETAKADSAATEAKTETTTAAMPDSAAMMKAWQEFMTPGDMHKLLEKTNGTWDVDISHWMAADAPPTKSKATLVQSSSLGGRFVVGRFKGTAFGQPMEGISTMGYDNARKLFVSTWIDNLGTGIVSMTGTYDEKTKTFNIKGFQTDPMTGKDSNIREEMTMIDNDSYTMIMYGDGMDGKEMKFMEGIYKRKK